MFKAFNIISLICLIGISGCGDSSSSSDSSSSDNSSEQSSISLLRTSGTNIVNEDGDVILLKGFNLGGWFVMEDYMSPMDADEPGESDSYSVMETLNDRFGVDTQRELMQAYQETWITADDIQNIADAGFNVVRIPVWWGQFFDLDDPTESGFRDDAFDVLDNIVEACEERGVYVIIDLHGAIGGQSTNSHTGQAGSNTFWTDSDAQSNTAWLWTKIAAHYQGNSIIAAFDLLNEPDVRNDDSSWTDDDTSQVLSAYDLLYKAVRKGDANRMVIIEGTFGNWNWSQLPDPGDYGWTNVVYEMHEYQWDSSGGTNTDSATVMAGIDNQVEDFENHKDWGVPGYIGEFNTFSTDSEVWEYAINKYNSAGLSWSMWSYKSVNGVAPNFWGWYDPYKWPERPSLSTDSAADIKTKWQNWKTSSVFSLNSTLGIAP